MDPLGFEPRAFRMRSGCDTTTPCARTQKQTTRISTPFGQHVAILIHRTACTGFALEPRDCILKGSYWALNPKPVLNYTPEA